MEKGYKHVKMHLKKDMFIAECRCMIVKGPYGLSFGVFLDQSPPEVRKKFEKAERAVREECMSKQDEGLIWNKYLAEFDAEDVEIIKNSVVWAKVPGPSVVRNLPLKQMITAEIVFRFEHVFWNEQRISVICFVKNIRQKRSASSNFDELKTVTLAGNL